MIGKLLKHEWKATYKTFLCMYGALGIIFITAFLGRGLRIDFMSELAVFAMSCAVLPVIIIYFVTILKRYQTNIYGAEGYLTNTLPVKPWEILLSKFVVAVFWGVATLVIGVVFGILMMWALGIAYVALSDIPMIFSELVRMYGFGEIFLVLATFFVFSLTTILQMYLSISIANLPVVTKANGLVALIAYFVLGRVSVAGLNGVYTILGAKYDETAYYMMSAVECVGDMVSEYVGITLVVGIGFALVYFFATHYILKKHFSIR